MNVFILLLLQFNEARLDETDGEVIKDFTNAYFSLIKEPSASLGNPSKFSSGTAAVSIKALAVGRLFSRILKEPERQTVDLKTQIYWMLKDMASKISSEIRISNEEQFLESIKLEYSARIDEKMSSYYLELKYLADTSINTSPNYLLNICSGKEESPKGMFYYLRKRLYEQCDLSRLKRELDGPNRAKILFMRISLQAGSDATKEEMDKLADLEEDTVKSDNILDILEEIEKDLKKANIKSASDAIAIVERAKRRVDDISQDNRCLLQLLSRKHNYHRELIYNSVEIFRRDLINTTILHVYCSMLLDVERAKILGDIHTFEYQLKLIAQNMQDYINLVLNKYWTSTVSLKVSESFGAQFDGTKWNETTRDLNKILSEFGPLDTKHQIYAFPTRRDLNVKDVTSTFSFVCHQPNCQYFINEKAVVLIVRIGGTGIISRYSVAADWYHENKDQISKYLYDQLTSYFTKPILDELKTKFSVYKTSFIGYGIARSWNAGRSDTLTIGFAEADFDGNPYLVAEPFRIRVFWDGGFFKKAEALEMFLLGF